MGKANKNQEQILGLQVELQSTNVRITEMQVEVHGYCRAMDVKLEAIQENLKQLIESMAGVNIFMNQVSMDRSKEAMACSQCPILRSANSVTSVASTPLPRKIDFTERERKDNAQFFTFPLSKIEFPRFEGYDPRGWVLKCLAFFQMHPLPNPQRVLLAYYHLEGRAYQWVRNYFPDINSLTWDQLSEELCERFLEEDHGDVIEEFGKLRKTGRVRDYQTKFEELRLHMLGKIPTLTEEYFVKSFLGGLKVEIRSMVKMFYPQTLMQTMDLARMYEYHLELANRKGKNGSFQTNVQGGRPSGFSKDHKLAETKGINNPIIKKLSLSEMQASREKRLCYNCDEIYKVGLKCKKQQLYMMELEEVAGNEEDSELMEEQPVIYQEASQEGLTSQNDEMTISLNAFSGCSSNQTLRILGNQGNIS